MKNSKSSLLYYVLLAVCVRIAMLFYTPSTSHVSFTPEQLTLENLFLNPCVQCVLLFSFAFMFSVTEYVIRKDKINDKKSNQQTNGYTSLLKLMRGIGIVLFALSIYVAMAHWPYISTHFEPLFSFLTYNSYNPTSSNEDYYSWKYSITPAKAIVSLILFPIIVPLLYHIRVLFKRQSRL